MLKQILQQKLQQKLSPQQIQLMKMLQIPTMELEQRIKEEMEINPALEEGNDDEPADELKLEEPSSEESSESREGDDFDLSDYFDADDIPEYKLYTSNHSADDKERETPLGSGHSFHDLLYAQLGLRSLEANEHLLSKYLIGNLDENGYLRRELAAVVNDLAFNLSIKTTVAALENALHIIQDLDPPGVGARDLRECLLIQIKKSEDKDEVAQLAEKIISQYFEEFTKKHYDKIINRLDITPEILKPAIDFILRLNPKPGNSMIETSRTVQHIIPDFILTTDNDEFKLSLNSRNVPDLRISKEYKNMLDHYAKTKDRDAKEKEALLFVKQKIDAAKWFIDAITQRNETLLYCMRAIVDYQKEFFLTGDETKLKPMILKDIADRVNMDISTISRVANSKYIQTHFGTYLLKYFFSESVNTEDGEEVSSREVKKILQDAVDTESKKKPLTDDKLGKLLNEKGYNIARRTVAKYREQLGIPVARLRKEL